MGGKVGKYLLVSSNLPWSWPSYHFLVNEPKESVQVSDSKCFRPSTVYPGGYVMFWKVSTYSK